MKRRLIDKFIYSITKKPQHYKEVKDPPQTALQKLTRPQDARQVQYNNWSRRHQIYSGSYLPYQEKELKKRGWATIHPSANSYETEHIRKSTGQHVLRHGKHINRKGILEPTHYHWKNPSAKALPKKERNAVYYYDKFGQPCKRESDESHLKPFKTRRRKK